MTGFAPFLQNKVPKSCSEKHQSGHSVLPMESVCRHGARSKFYPGVPPSLHSSGQMKVFMREVKCLRRSGRLALIVSINRYTIRRPQPYNSFRSIVERYRRLPVSSRALRRRSFLAFRISTPSLPLPFHRSSVICMFPSLKSLDFAKVTEDEKDQGRRASNRGLIPGEWKQDERS